MRLIAPVLTITASLMLAACVQKGPNPDDPYESVNRKVHDFNMAFDATMLKPPAKLYKAVMPGPIRAGVHNAFVNLNSLPIIANDALQFEWGYVIKDSWRFIINSTFGVAGFFDPAEKWGLPHHSNDFGLTLAKWGDKKSPYIVIPLLGPSTIRDGMGLLYDGTLFSPYIYMSNDTLVFSLLAAQYLDLRTQLLDTERMLDQALDKYSFIRDAYLQHRNYAISGEIKNQQPEEIGSLYIDEDELGDYIDDDASADIAPVPENKKDRKKENTTPQQPSSQVKNAPRSPVSA